MRANAKDAVRMFLPSYPDQSTQILAGVEILSTLCTRLTFALAATQSPDLHKKDDAQRAAAEYMYAVEAALEVLVQSGVSVHDGPNFSNNMVIHILGTENAHVSPNY